MKSLKLTLFGILLLSVTAWWACNKDHLVSDGQMVDVAFAGEIIDEYGVPVADAQVRVGVQTVLTDGNGVFRTPKVKMPDNNAILHISKTGYFDFSRAYFAEDEAVQTVTIQLLKKIQSGTFVNAAGGSIHVPGGPTLHFPPNATTGSGTVRVYTRYLSPTDEALSLMMPGDLRAINLAGEEQTLATFGMLAVELESGGHELQVAEGKEVEMTMPISESQAALAPAEISLWHFDPEKARWIEEGTAQKEGNQYVAKVKHFSFWNCDIGLPLVNLKGKIYIGDMQHPLENVTIQLTVLSTGWQRYAFTNENGYFGGSVIKDEAMELTVQLFNPCQTEVLYRQIIGPFSGDVVLNPIVISTSQQQDFIRASGMLADCAGEPISNGYILTDGHIRCFTDESGRFDAIWPNCTNAADFTIQGFDMKNFRKSPEQNIPISMGNLVDVGILTVCTGVDEYIEFKINGQQYIGVDPQGIIRDSMNNERHIFLQSHIFNANNTRIYMHFIADRPGEYAMRDGYWEVNNNYIVEGHHNTFKTRLNSFPAQAGDYFMGTFSATAHYQDSAHPISGSYRVKRSQ